MNIYEAAKCLSGMSHKLIPKDDTSFGLITMAVKGDKAFMAVSSNKFSCVVPVAIKHNLDKDLQCMVDGKLLSKVVQKLKLDTVEFEYSLNIEGQPSSLLIKSESNTNVSVSLSPLLSALKQKKLTSSHYVVNRECFVSSLKSTVNAGSDIDAERPYYYALIGVKDKNISCTCGNGSFFAHVECDSLSVPAEKDYCLLPIPVALSLIPLLEQCEDKEIKLGFDDNAIVIHAECMKFSLSIDRKCVSWPDASSILNRKTGDIYKIDISSIKEIANSIDLASDGYESKNDTLKCKMSLSKDKLTVNVDGSCKIESYAKLESENEAVKVVMIDAACISISLKSKMLGSTVEINIDDSSFKGRPSPVVMSSSSDKCSYKTFFAVT